MVSSNEIEHDHPLPW